MKPIHESEVELYALEELQALGYGYLAGPDLLPDGPTPERKDPSEVILVGRLRQALAWINPQIPEHAREDALKKVLGIHSPDLLANNEAFHRFLTEGVPVTYRKDGDERPDLAWLVDFKDPTSNDFQAVNQFTVIEGSQHKRPDIVLFVNGLPLVVVELKNPADENATVAKAFEQIQTYKATIPTLFTTNALCVISDGLDSRAGTVSSDFARFMAWKTADGKEEASRRVPQLETLIRGMLRPDILLDLVQHFVVFEKTRREDLKTGLLSVVTVKKVAAYHQYHAVNKALRNTVHASSLGGDRRGGVVWHTQGSGKSLSMVFFAGKLVQALDNPTIVVITDRNDLDDQLFDTFAASKQLLRQDPVQAENREHLKTLLRVASGGIVFSTIQKFVPEDGGPTHEELSGRRNIVVIADEAHRTQYGFEARLADVRDPETKEVIGKRLVYGFAKYMRDALPQATYIGFTGTPIENDDVNTPAIFGNYVDVYDIGQAVDDGATVRIYYESRLAKVNLDEEGRKLVDTLDQELSEGEEATASQKAKAKWTQLEAIVGSEGRIRNLARDIVTHFEARQSVFQGKGMIVTMSRRIASALFEEIEKIRPDWIDSDLSKGAIKVVMTSSSDDGPKVARHHTTKAERRALADRIRDPSDPLKLVIVRDMWLTGFDAPCLHTLYIDKPMKGHNLMQAIARVNRVFKDKPGGLVVDYLGIATDLKKALSFYSDAGGKGDPTEIQEKAVRALQEKLEIVRQMFSESSDSAMLMAAESPSTYSQGNFDYGRFFTASAREKMGIILQAEEHILGLDQGKQRFGNEVSQLGRTLALSVPHEKAMAAMDEIAFFQAVRARLVKFDTTGGGESGKDWDSAIRQIVDQAIASDQVIDIFDAAGIQKPDISILSEDFLQEVQGMKHKNLALELLRKILNDEIKAKSRTNLVRGRALLEMLDDAIKRYQNQLLSTAEVIQHLIDLAKELRQERDRAGNMNLTEDELAFYDALETNDSAVQVLGDDQLRAIAREIAERVKANATIDWTLKESARANLMRHVGRVLRLHGYPPDKQNQAIETVLKQAELLADKLTN
jgi:type I restriction enzyme, R subunit